MTRYNLISLLGIFVLIALGWAGSSHRRVFNLRCILGGTLLQLALGALLCFLPFSSRLFLLANDAVVTMLNASLAGARFCFGPLAQPPGTAGSLGFILLFQGFPTIVFFATIMALLYYWRVMPWLIRLFSRLFTRLLGVSGAEALCTATNIFAGVESSTSILPHLARMTRSELGTVLVAGMATVAANMLGLYVMFFHQQFPQLAGHLMSASLLAAPAALVMSKLLLPETGRPETLGRDVAPHYEREGNWIEAAIRGATAGGSLVMGVVILLLAFLGLVELANLGLDRLAGWLSVHAGWHGSLRLEHLLAYPFYPLALVIGVPPVDAWEVARLLAMRLILTEVPAYQELARLIATGGLHEGRSVVLASYALCGFAHIASVAIFVGGTAALAPNQTRTLAQIAGRALVAATLTCLMTAAIAGVFYGHGAMVLTLK